MNLAQIMIVDKYKHLEDINFVCQITYLLMKEKLCQEDILVVSGAREAFPPWGCCCGSEGLENSLSRKS